jgi:YVTN family beta-propeller protein
MGRNAVLSGLLGLTLAGGVTETIPTTQNTSPSMPSTRARPIAEIPFARVPPDAVVALTFEPGAVASDDAVWVRARNAGAIARIQAKDNTVGTPMVVGAEPCASLALAFGSVWVPLCGDRGIARVDLKERRVSTTLKPGVASDEGQIATSVGSLWVVSDRKGVLSRIDPDTNAPVAEVYVAGSATAVVAGDAALWVTSEDGNRLTRVNPHTNEVVETIEVGSKPGRVAVGEGGVWTLNRGDGSVTRVDPVTNKVVATIPIGPAVAAGEIATGAGSVWVSAPGLPIVRIDPRTNRAVQQFTGDGGGAILVAHGSLWVAAGPNLTWRLDPQLVAGVRP